MTIYLIFRIIGWFLIIVTVFGICAQILSIGKIRPKEPISAELVLFATFLHILTIWFIYTAMQI